MRYYRDGYGMKTWNGILFNHESPRRGENFITRKITLSIARILSGKQQYLEVGNMDARRDWGYAPDYVEAMWLMLQSGKPDDYVVATGETHSVREFIEKACDVVGVKPETIVKVNPSYIRPVDVGCLCGDASKIKRVVGWESNVCFSELVDIMMKADMEKLIWK
jgi:GDPmannose 4,6-dehydratase